MHIASFEIWFPHVFIVVLGPVGQLVVPVVQSCTVISINWLDDSEYLFWRTWISMATKMEQILSLETLKLQIRVIINIRYQVKTVRHCFLTITATRGTEATMVRTFLLLRVRSRRNFRQPLRTGLWVLGRQIDAAFVVKASSISFKGHSSATTSTNFANFLKL